MNPPEFFIFKKRSLTYPRTALGFFFFVVVGLNDFSSLIVKKQKIHI